MALYAIADLHLSMSEGVDKPMDIYGGAWVDHENRLRENWLAEIGPEDTVLIPGDISWALYLRDAMADLAWIDSLPGTKLLLRGNHDPWWSSMAKMRGLFESIKFIQNDAYDGGDFIVFGSRGWVCPGDKLFKPEQDQKIYERELIRLQMSADCAVKMAGEGQKSGLRKTIIGALHYPPTNEKKQPSGFTDIFAKAGCQRVVYGHLHGEYVWPNGPEGWMYGINYTNVALDRLDCRPLRLL